MPRAAHDVLPFAEVRSQVEACLARDDTKAAVELARSAHAQLGTQAAEALAVDAYRARIAHLDGRGLKVEARQLADSVRKKYPSARARLPDPDGRPSLEELVRPLSDPALAPDARERLEAVVRRDVVDLAALGAVSSLEEGHPLRGAARALAAALDAVTRGPVTDEALLLPEVSRKSPLAPWKALVCAIACYQRGDDARCEEQLARIPEDAAPGRAVASVRALIRGEAVAGFAQKGPSLRDTLERLEAAFAARRPKPIARAIEAAVAACAHEAPDRLDELRRRVSVRGVLAGLDAHRVRLALGAPPRRCTAFWQLLGCALELQRERVASASAWLEARRVGPIEGRFAAEGPEVAALTLHAAELLARAADDGDDDDGDVRLVSLDLAAYYRDQPADVRWAPKDWKPPTQPPAPAALYAEACRLDPHPEAFQGWLAWASRDEEADPKAADAVARAWHAALPADPAPLVHLVASAEARGALAEALRHLEAAERLDGVDPSVRRARLRLLVATACRHAKQKKPHLLRKDVDALEALPAAREGAGPALVAALRAVEADLRGAPEAASLRAKIPAQLGSALAASLVLDAVARGGGQRGRTFAFVSETKDPPCVGAARAALLLRSAGLALGMPTRLLSEITRDANEDAPGAEPAELAALAETMLSVRGGATPREMVWAVAGAGLRRGGPTTARFLLLRARSLPDFSRARRRDAGLAAAELARRQRDTALVAEAIEVARAAAPWTGEDAAAKADEVLARERADRTYPRAPTSDDLSSYRCDCPACRARARFGGDDDDDDDDPDLDDDDLDDLELPPLRPDASPLERALWEALSKSGGPVPDMDALARTDPDLVRRLVEEVKAADEATRGRSGRDRRGRLPW